MKKILLLIIMWFVLYLFTTQVFASQQILTTRSTTSMFTSLTGYQSIMGIPEGAWSSIESQTWGKIAADGNLSNLLVEITAVTFTGVGDPDPYPSYDFNIIINSSATLLGCKITQTVNCEDLTHSISVHKGDTVSIRTVPTATPNASELKMSLIFDSDVNNETILTGGTGSSVMDNINTTYVPLHGKKVPETTRANSALYLPSGFTLKKFYAQLNGAPGTGNKYDFNVSYQTSEFSGVTISRVGCTISGAATTCFNDVNTLHLNAGATITLRSVPTSSPDENRLTVGLVLVPDTNGQFLIPASTADTSSIISTEYFYSSAGDGFIDATRTETDTIVNAFTASKIVVLVSTPIGDLGSYDFNLLGGTIGATTTGSYCNITGSDLDATFCSKVSDVNYSKDDGLGWKITPNGVPTAFTWANLTILGRTTPAPADTCTYSGSGDFTIQCFDACIINSSINLAGSDLIIKSDNGNGTVEFNADLNNVDDWSIETACKVIGLQYIK